MTSFQPGADQGEVKSPNYPRNYPHNSNKSYPIQVRGFYFDFVSSIILLKGSRGVQN